RTVMGRHTPANEATRRMRNSPSCQADGSGGKPNPVQVVYQLPTAPRSKKLDRGSATREELSVMQRRRFLHHSLSLTAGLALASARPAADTEPLPVLDTHQHLWDVQKFRLPWIKKGDPFDRNYLLHDYLEATKGLNVVKAIYMEVDVDPAQHVAEAE